jgi:hypothetical protein
MNMTALGPTLHELPPNRVKRLHNVVCPYCGAALTNAVREKEHVIGRNFVPRGKLQAQWNLIVNACRTCNRRKSGFEDDISAITMQPDAYGKFGVDDPDLVAEARRKAARSGSRTTGKAVKDSMSELKFSVVPMPGMSIDFSFVAPPQAENDRAYELARMQLQAFFFMITYNESLQRGWWWPGEFMPYLHSRKSDWGSKQWLGFMRVTRDWDTRVHAVGANEFFCCSIRRHPTAECWSWAFEWNCQHRLAGFLGNRQTAQAIVNAIPPEELSEITLGPNRFIRFRADVALADDDDTLFSLPADAPGRDHAGQATAI